MKTHTSLLARVLTAILILGAHSQLRAQSISYFLYATGQGTGAPLEGSTENTVYKPLKAVEVLSFSFAGTNPVTITGTPSAGQSQFNPLELVIQDDPKVLPGLILRMAIGSHYDDLVLDGATVGQSGTEVFFKLKLKKVFVSAVNLSGTDGDRAVYNVALEWGAMQMTTWKRLPNGTLEQAAESSWSRVLNNNSFSVTP